MNASWPRLPWTREHDAVLLTHIGTTRIAAIAHKVGRTEYAVMKRAYTLGLRWKHEARRAHGMGVHELTQALGVDRETIKGWIARGQLAATRTPMITDTTHSISADDVSDFLEAGGALMRCLKPTDLAWREEIAAARARLAARYISSRVLIAALGYGPRLPFADWHRRYGFPRPALRLGSRNGGDYYDRAAVRAWLAANPRYQSPQAGEI